MSETRQKITISSQLARVTRNDYVDNEADNANGDDNADINDDINDTSRNIPSPASMYCI